jgi:hypothetical protein
MQNSNSNLNTGRFLRLIAISSVEMLLSIPFSTWVMAQNVRVMQFTQSWADLHYQFSRIIYASVDSRSVSSEAFALLNFSRWIPVFTAFLYFAFFGMQEEAMSGYASAWEALRRACGRIGKLLPWSSRCVASPGLHLPAHSSLACLLTLILLLCYFAESEVRPIFLLNQPIFLNSALV